MRYTIHYDEGAGMMEVVATGRASLEGDAGLIQSILEHPHFRPGLPVLLDQTGLETAHLSQRDMRDVADLCARIADTLGDGHCAILVRADVDFGMARMFEALVGERVAFRTRVFRSRDEALAWLAEVGR